MTGPPQVDATDPEAAVAALAAGGVVGLPTDTVYGLAARLDRPAAVAAIFGLKGRPAGLALPVLVADVDQARSLAASWSDGVAERQGYSVIRSGIGPDDTEVGSPTQMAVFSR